MKNKLLLIIIGLSFITASAQFGPQQIISNNSVGALRSIPYDVDNDNFTDVVSASYGYSKIVWHKNDGQGNFGTEQIISNSAVAIQGLELFDLDSDGDMDILYRTNLDKIAWLNNLDGLGNFSTERIISDLYYPYFINAADLDGDGDLDILALVHSNSVSNSIIWYENTDGLGDFSDAIFIDTHFDSSSGLETIDIDNDNDLDIITSFNHMPAILVWFENIDSFGNFDDEKEIYQFNYNSSWTNIFNITTSDINGNGLTDIFIDTYHEEGPDYIYWLENLGGQGNFTDPQFIYQKESHLNSLRSFDLDNDGDNDLVLSFNTYFSWFENTDGNGSFGLKQNISSYGEGGVDATVADLNYDGLNDVITASWTEGEIAWYENGVLGVSENTENSFKLFPNPTEGKINLVSNEEIVLIEVINIYGQNIIAIENNQEIDLTNLASGIYFITIKNLNGYSETHKIIKE